MVKVRLLGYESFEASKRFLHGLEEQIWVSRWERYPKIRRHRPANIGTPERLQAELAKPSMVTVVSAHAYRDDKGRLYFCGEESGEVLPVDCLARPGGLGAASMVMIDACWFEVLAAALQPCAQPGSLIVGVKTEDMVTRGQDSVSVLGAVIGELCYLEDGDLSTAAVRQAISSVNAQTDARNRAENGRVSGTKKKPELRPSISWYPCLPPQPGQPRREAELGGHVIARRPSAPWRSAARSNPTSS
jgi:hypothetical protein